MNKTITSKSLNGNAPNHFNSAYNLTWISLHTYYTIFIGFVSPALTWAV